DNNVNTTILDHGLATLAKRKIEAEECPTPNKRPKEITSSTSTIGKIITTDKTGENILAQENSCNNKKFLQFNRCQACVNKKSDRCRFKNFRYFDIDPVTYEIIEGSNFISDQNPAPMLESRGIPLSQEDKHYILDLIAPTFRTILQNELSHIDKALCRKIPETNSRQLCDICQHIIFSGFWICIVCGREMCITCYDEWDDLSPETFLTLGKCSFRRRHEKKHMLGVCFYQRSEIEKFYMETCKILKDDPIINEDNITARELIESTKRTKLIILKKPIKPIRPTKSTELVESKKSMESTKPTTAIESFEPTVTSPAFIKSEPDQQSLDKSNDNSIITEKKNTENLSITPTINCPINNNKDYLVEPMAIDSEIYDNSHESHYQLEWDNGEMTLEQFREFWKKGYPFVVRNLKYEDQLWNPVYLSRQFGNIPCDTIDCKTEKVYHTTVKAFFDGFVNLERRPKHQNNITYLKLKDWPSNRDFAKKFPDHFKDFMSVMPFAQYSTYGGSMNLVNQLPAEYIISDLGPKMYCAYGSDDGLKGVGTSKLHLNAIDTVNLMTHAPEIHDRLPDEQLKPAAAVWDFYHANDLPKVRKFLHEHSQKMGIRIDDPIHDQRYYLNELLRAMLLQEQGVKGWRIYQNPGDMVFIPAGCAHQVCNYTACVKVAVDFVSPESVNRIYNVGKELYRISHNHARHEDILQLPNILLHAWKVFLVMMILVVANAANNRLLM
ncbi:10250_t:CDS:2, partial [Entrophospora sp. SA101]